MSHRYLFLLSTSLNNEDYSLDVSLDAFHEMTTPRFDDEKVFEVAKQINPDLGKNDVQVIQMMTLRRNFNADRLKGPLMVTTDHPIERDDLEMYIKTLNPKNELKRFITNASI